MNEKGVSIAVLTLDSEPTYQQTGKPTITPTLAIRLVLDHAATTAEAVALLREYDMFASGGGIITSTSPMPVAMGVSWNTTAMIRPSGGDTPRQPPPTSTRSTRIGSNPTSETVSTAMAGNADTVLKILAQQKGCPSPLTVWDALRAVAQEPDSKDITSNTQWSICFHSSTLSADVALRRHWDNIFCFRLTENTATALS